MVSTSTLMGGDPVDPLSPKNCPECGSTRLIVALNGGGHIQRQRHPLCRRDADRRRGRQPTAAGGRVHQTTAAGAAAHVCELRVTPPIEDLAYHFVEVRGGEAIAQGMGDDLVDALLGVIEYMLPPDSGTTQARARTSGTCGVVVPKAP